MNQLTNQELVNELERRIQQGTLEVNIKNEQFKEETKSSLSYLDSKNLLLLVGLSVGFTLLVCHMMKVTTNSVTGGSLEFQEVK